MTSELTIDFVNNPEPRCPVVLLLDTSTSMDGERIKQLNQGIQTFKTEVCNDDKASVRVELAIVSFNSTVKIEQDFITVDKFIPKTLSANGSTSLGAGITKSLEILDKRKTFYREYEIPYYLPWVFLITDGFPTDDWKSSSIEIQLAVDNHRLSFFVVGVEGADIEFLHQISSDERPPVMLKGLLFKELFSWMSSSLMRVSTSNIGNNDIDLPDISAWAKVKT